MNMQDRKPSADDKKYTSKAVRMLTFIACLNSVMYDLEDALSEAGMFKHSVKYRCNMASSIARIAHVEAYDMLRTISPNAAREYNSVMEKTYNTICSHITLPPIEKYYNIVMALVRLITELNNELLSRYNFIPARALLKVEDLLSVCKIKDYKIDNIILINI